MNKAAQQRAAIRRLTESARPRPCHKSDDVQQIVVEEARRLTDAASAALCLLAPEGRDMLDFVPPQRGKTPNVDCRPAHPLERFAFRTGVISTGSVCAARRA